MTEVMQIREAAGHLPAADRADLAAYLLDAPSHWVDDEEVAQRRQDLASSKVTGLTRAEFDRACGR
jgi:hypothetical protein